MSLFGVPGSTVALLALQFANAGLMAWFGVLALRVGPNDAAGRRHAAWSVTGVAFTMIGVVATAHSGWAAWAVFAGTESAVYRAYLRFHPALNDARSSGMLGYAGLLAAVTASRTPPPRAAGVAAGVALCLAAGAAVGYLGEGAFTAPLHFVVLSAFGGVTLVLLLAALYLALVRRSFDYLLWFALAIYAAREGLIANFTAMLAWLGAGETLFTGSTMLALMMGATLLMVVCARRRLAAARTGRTVPSLLDRLRK